MNNAACCGGLKKQKTKKTAKVNPHTLFSKSFLLSGMNELLVSFPQPSYQGFSHSMLV